MKKTVRINFEYSAEEYKYLKMFLAANSLTVKEFGSFIFSKALEEYEDEVLGQLASHRIKDFKEEEWVSWDEACKLAGWEVD